MSFQLSTIVFTGTAGILFYLINPACREFVLVLASFLFCYFIDPFALAVLLGITAITYLAGYLADKETVSREAVRKASFVLTILLYIALFIFWKYFHLVDTDQTLLKNLMPVGFSFYTFQAISYLADVYKGEIKHEKNILHFILYMSLFTKLISGPIERASKFIPQTEMIKKTRFMDGSRAIRSMSYIIWGLFLKLMIADRAGDIVDNVFYEYREYGSIMLVTGSLLYTIQIYCDFAGYTNIAIGISNIFGIELSENFKTPYFSENITEFWHSWHMTLSSFLRDYIYIPLGGNRKGKARRYINVIIVFLVCGMWHGNGLKFIAWGLLHGIYSVATAGIKGVAKLGFLISGITGRIVTFCLVSMAWVFFRAGNIGVAVNYIRFIFIKIPYAESLQQEIERAGTTPLQLLILGISICVLFFCDLKAYRCKTVVPKLMIESREAVRDACFLILAVVILVFGVYGNQEVRNFIYMEF